MMLAPADLHANEPRAERLARVQQDVRVLSETIGDRNVTRPRAYADAAEYVTQQLTAAGYTVVRQPYVTDGVDVANLIAELPGSNSDEHVLVGAHYDSCYNPGADDNASGVAGLLEIARALRGARLRRTVRLVAFANEEPPYFQTPHMGSQVYVHRADGQPAPSAVLILEMLGYYTDVPRSQRYPPLFGWGRPNAGNFIGVVGNWRSRRLVRLVATGLRRHGPVPVESIAAPESVEGVAWSDQWAFWRAGIRAVMITDTAFFRNPHYHTGMDTWETLDYPRLTQVIEALIDTVRDLAGPSA